MTKKIISITLAISWLYNPDEIPHAFNKARLLKHIEQISRGYGIQIVPFFCIQFDTLEDLNDFTSFPVEFLSLYGRGLSRSRNAVINYSTTDYIHLLDLDIDFVDIDLYISTIADSVLKNPVLLLIHPLDARPKSLSYRLYHFTHYSLKPHCPLLSKAFRSFYCINSFPSYCIIVNRYFLASHSLFFNEHLGLGSKYPQSEENIFISNILRSSKSLSSCSVAILNYSGFSGVSSSHLEFSFPQMVSKGIFLFKIFSALGVLFIPISACVFSFKAFPTYPLRFLYHCILFLIAISIGYLISLRGV